MSFAEDGRATLDWAARYLERVDGLPVLAQVGPGEIRSRLPASPPEDGEPFASVLRDLDVSNTAFAGNGLKAVAELPAIEVLRLDSAKLTDAGLYDLRGATTLTELYLSDARITDTGIGGYRMRTR